MGQPGGIRSKVRLWFCLVFVFMVGSSVALFWIVRTVEEKHFSIEKADVFLENILEVRRMEKNYLLYQDHKSMEEWTKFLTATVQNLTESRKVFVWLSSEQEIDDVALALHDYQQVYARFLAEDADPADAAIQIREQGNRLTTLTEELIVREHRTIHRLLALIRNTLLFVLPFIVLVFSSIAVFLGKGIVSSLKQLEQHAATIAAGNFVEVPFVSSNREINSLVNAFNQMSRELKSRQQQLVRSEKLASLGTMLAGVAHEFNNPLSNISSSAEILTEELRGAEGEFARELAQQITDETSRASAIIHTLLSLAREEIFHRDYYPLKSLCQEVLVLLRGHLGQDVKVLLDVPGETLIFADKQKIQQVFINLLRNSSDAMSGVGTIRIQAWRNQEGLKITVSDDGPGISMQVQGKIFDPFFTTKDTGQGAGLGLFIVHDIIIQHGGSIRVKSTNKGASFIMNLPEGEST